MNGHGTTALLLACIGSVLVGDRTAAAETRTPSFVVNGGYERGGRGWTIPARTGQIVSSGRDGHCLKMTAGGASQDIYVGEGATTFTVAVDMKAVNIRPAAGRGYAYVAVYQVSRDGQYVAFHDFAQCSSRQSWQRHSYTFTVPPQARLVSLRCGIFNATGVAWFDNWTLVPGRQAKRLDEVREPQRHGGTKEGVVGIFREPGFPAMGTASSPETLARILSETGVQTGFLNVRQLSDPLLLRPSDYGLIVLPYGASFPAAARDSFIRYLHTGGGFLSMGGYAFNNLLVREGNHYVPEPEALRRRLAEAVRTRNLLPDGGFEGETTRAVPPGGRDMNASWHRSSADCRVVTDNPAEGRWCARVNAERFRPGGEVKWDLHLPARTGRRYRVMARIRTRQVTGPGFAYLACYRYDARDKLLKSTDFAQVRGTTGWRQYRFDFTPEPGTTTIYLKCGLYQAAGVAWFDDFRLVDITDLEFRPLNTATGTPRDGLIVSPTQIGVFDADYRLRRVAQVKTAPGQTFFPPGIHLGPVTGWAASAVRGYDNTRWIPLLAAYDRYGRFRGSAGSLVFNYAGFYEGSAWAFFGIENQDLFTGNDPKLRVALQRLVRFMLRGIYLRNLKTEYAAYRPGESVPVRVLVENQGPADQVVHVTFTVTAPGASATSKVLLQKTTEVVARTAQPAEATIVFTLPPGVFGLYRVTATLRLGHQPIDRMESGLVALEPRYAAPLAHAVAPQPPADSSLRLEDNYLGYGNRPLFLFGSDNYSNVYKSTTEGPLWWAREHAACRDFGFEIYENLQYSNPRHGMRPADWRAFAGMAQLTQQYGLTFMPGMLVGHDVAVSEEEIAAESHQVREYAAHLRATPRLLWYINGDYQLRHDARDTLRRKWNDYLRSRYQTTRALKQAWAPAPVPAELGKLPFPPANSGRWDDARQIDLHRFHIELMTGWNRAHVAALRTEDAVHPVTSEYYSTPFTGIDLRLTIDGQDLSNFGFFEAPGKDLEVLPLKLRWNDLRAAGKSVGLGEYGVKTHPAWEPENGARGYHLRRTEEEAKQLFLAIAHYTFGMGGSKVQNWCLRDANQHVFPWGVFYPGPLVPKDVAYVHRNLSLLFRLFAPRYRPPALTVLLCDAMRLGNAERLGVDSGYRCFETLLGLHADFNVVSDSQAAHLPASTRVVIWPSALCAGDETVAAVEQWVRRGGMLLVTGGPVYGENRRLTGTRRLRTLAGVDWVSLRYPPDARRAQPENLRPAPLGVLEPDGGTVLRTTADGAPLLVRHALGKGEVCFYADPVELAARRTAATLSALYRWFLAQANVPCLPIAPTDPSLFAFAQTTRTGVVYTCVNRRTGHSSQRVTIPTSAGPVSLEVKDGYPALAAVSRDGRVSVMEAYRSATAANTPMLTADGLAAVAALDARDLRRSEALLILPFSPGKVSVHRSRPWRRPVVLLGDVHGGAFRVLETLRPTGHGKPTISFDADRATLVALLCERAAAAHWRRVLSEWAASPEDMQGR